MNTVEKIFDEVKVLPEAEARQVLDFVGHLKARRDQNTITDNAALAQRRAELEKVFGKYQVDLSGFKFDREEANARS